MKNGKSEWEIVTETQAKHAKEKIFDIRTDFTQQQHADRVFEHLNYKFGEHGIVRFWTEAQEQREFAGKMKKIAGDKAIFDGILDTALAKRAGE